VVARITVACQILPEGTFAPQALLYTDLNAAALQIVSWCVLHWQLDVTYHEVRANLGVDGTLDNVVVSEHQAPGDEVTGHGSAPLSYGRRQRAGRLARESVSPRRTIWPSA
jgi:hypothetical protein